MHLLKKTPLRQHILRWRHTNHLCHMLDFLSKQNGTLENTLKKIRALIG